MTGVARFEGPVTIDCGFQCRSMRVEGRGYGPGGDVVVRGSLVVDGDADLDASVKVEEGVTAERLDVGGHLESGPITSKMVRVGGHLTTSGSLSSGDVDVGGHMKVRGEVEIVNLRVGGHAEVEGGTISGEVKVRGHFETTKKLTYGTINVFGKLSLPAGSVGEKLMAMGKVEFEGDTSCKAIEVNGMAEVNGSCSASNVQVNGKLDVYGSLKVTEGLEILGSTIVQEKTECGALKVGGRLVSDSVVSLAEARVAGEVRTTKGLKAKSVLIGTGSRVNGPVIGEEVEVGAGVDIGGFFAHATSWRTIGRMTRVDDVYGKEIRIDRYSQARRVFGDVIKMQRGSIADELVYTKDADIPPGVHLERPAKKVDRLPDAPI